MELTLRDFSSRKRNVTSSNHTTLYGLPSVIKVGDTEIPRLIQITPLEPTSTLNAFSVRNISAAPELVFELELFDDFSGIEYIEFSISNARGFSLAASLNVVNFPGGGNTFKTNATFPLTSLPPGVYRLSFSLSDFDGRKTSWDYIDFADIYGMPTLFLLGDIEPPNLIKITPLVPSTFNSSTIVINVTATPKLVFELELLDDFSGIQDLQFVLESTNIRDFYPAVFSVNVVNFPGGGTVFKNQCHLSSHWYASGRLRVCGLSS